MKSVFLFFALTAALCAQDERITIAVLPFENVTKNTDDEWLSRGFTEEVTAALSTIPSLIVVERAQLDKVIREQDFRMSDLAEPSRTSAVGSLLSAGKVLIGSYQVTGNRLLVHARVLDTQTGVVDEKRQFRLEDDLDNIFELYDALTQAIVEGFSIKLTTSQSKRLDKLKTSGTKNIKAYESYSRGMEAYNRGDKTSLKDARNFFRKAVGTDKKFTVARQALANTYIKLDELDDAIKEYEKIKKSSVDVTEDILNTLGLFYRVKGKPEKALENFQAAITMNAHYAEGYKNIGLVFYSSNRYDDALENFRRADKLESENAEYLYLIASSLMQNGKQYEALNALRDAFDNGFHDKTRLDKDPAWNSVRFSDPFRNLLEEYFD